MIHLWALIGVSSEHEPCYNVPSYSARIRSSVLRGNLPSTYEEPNCVFDDSVSSSIGRAALSRRGVVEHPLQKSSTPARRHAPASAMLRLHVVVRDRPMVSLMTKCCQA